VGVVVRWTGHELADLALALAAAATRIDAVLDTAARAAAELVGDGAGVRLSRTDDAPTVYHADPERAQILARSPSGPIDLRGAREPIVLSPLTAHGFQELAQPEYRTEYERAGISACVLCPLLAGEACLGYLAIARTTPGGTYTDADVDLARDIAGEVALALATARSMELLRTSEERYRRIVETALEGVWQLDPAGVTTSVNERMADMLGVPREQLPGLSMSGFLDDRSRADLPRWLAECHEGDPTVHKTRLVRADGAVRWVQVAAAPMPGQHAEPGGSLCMVSDITEQEQARGLKRQLDHLRRLDSLGQLIGGIAHDFNNLLTVIAGSAEVVAGEAEPGSTRQQLATEIAEATVRGRTLAHHLLAFGRSGGRSETVPVSDLLSSVTQLLGRTIGEHIKLEITVEPDAWPVRTERGPLEQVLVNLAANSRDAMPRGGVLTIRADNVDVEPGQLDDRTIAGRFVRVALADTGAGMDKETQARAFEI